MGTLDKSYDPKAVEPKWLQRWAEDNVFSTDETSDKPAFCIVIPPPNVTGRLHMGHALFATLQDVMTRWKRMAGYEALWLPGTDHAGIATQVLVERKLRAEGIDPVALGRDKFIEKVWEWKALYHARITEQLKTMAVSVDWERERFTMDDGLNLAVRTTFVSLYDQGLIYQDDRLVNWDPVGQTVLSDLEVDQEEEDGFLWHIAYPMADDPERKLVVATTRPETLLGDTAVAVHPDDERYADLVGKQVTLPLTGRTIPVISDPEAADMEFGSGAVKITPAHDFNDFETGKRNGLERIQILDKDVRINANGPEKYRGMKRDEARVVIEADLETLGLLVKKEPYRFTPGRSQRTGAVIEPLSIGKQWFVDAKKLAVPAIVAVRDGTTTIVPKMWEKTYFNWMENIRDWCVSRQLWWGHRVPAWYTPDGEVIVSVDRPTAEVAGCDPDLLEQDPDVLDTWFSSGLWPFSTLGWPEKTAALEKWYPTSVMETGYDILFFWVARMMMFGLHFMGEVPFKTVYLHGMVRDKSGKKMSKMKGNVIDPLHIIHGIKPANLTTQERTHYEGLLVEFPDGIAPQGADALRFALSVFSAQGRDVKLDVRRIEGYRAFLNKLWNASKFALNHLDGFEPRRFDYQSEYLSPADRWILGRLHQAVVGTNEGLEAFGFSDAADTIYHFLWDEFCDWYLELSKAILYADAEPGSDAAKRKDATKATLYHTLDTVLRLLHPFSPLVTEEIWQALPRKSGDPSTLVVATWPTSEHISDVQDRDNTALAIQVIAGVRSVRGNNNISPAKELPHVLLLTQDAATQAQLEQLTAYVCSQAKIVKLDVVTGDVERPQPCATTVQGGIEIVIALKDVIDLDAERVRLSKEVKKTENDIAFVSKRLSNPKFAERAPEAVVQKEREKLVGYELALVKLQAALEALE